MMKTNNVRKSQLLICYYLVLLLLFLSLLFSNVYGSDPQTDRSESLERSFLFENFGKDVPEALVEQIKLYWQYKGSLLFESAYNIEAPHTKYQIPSENYLHYHDKARKLKGCKILNVDRQGDLAIVRIQLIFDDKDKRSAKTIAKTQTVKERWIELNSRWYHVYQHPFANIR